MAPTISNGSGILVINLFPDELALLSEPFEARKNLSLWFTLTFILLLSRMSPLLSKNSRSTSTDPEAETS